MGINPINIVVIRKELQKLIFVFRGHFSKHSVMSKRWVPDYCRRTCHTECIRARERL